MTIELLHDKSTYPDCKCDECGKVFKYSDLIELSGVTMGGYGDSWNEYVSPCCNADYEEV